MVYNSRFIYLNIQTMIAFNFYSVCTYYSYFQCNSKRLTIKRPNKHFIALLLLLNIVILQVLTKWTNQNHKTFDGNKQMCTTCRCIRGRFGGIPNQTRLSKSVANWQSGRTQNQSTTSTQNHGGVHLFAATDLLYLGIGGPPTGPILTFMCMGSV